MRGRKPKGFNFMSFEDAKVFLRQNGIRSLEVWQQFCKSEKRPAELPAAPHKQYKDQWKGFPDFLGYTPSGRGRKPGSLNKPKEDLIEKLEDDKPVVINTTMYTYEEAKQWCRRLNYTEEMYRKFVTNAPFHTPGTVYARLPRQPSDYYEDFNANEFYSPKSR